MDALKGRWGLRVQALRCGGREVAAPPIAACGVFLAQINITILKAFTHLPKNFACWC